MGLKFVSNYSPNFSLPKRSKKDIKFIILHYTGMKRENYAIKRLLDPKAKVSAHYFVKKNGKILNLVPDLYEAWHAGKSSWKSYKSLNANSIGIEIHNPGHENNYRNFTSYQIRSLKYLLKFLIKKYNLNYKNVIGHSDVAPYRKKDPGEKFPWKLLARKGLVLWHKCKETKLIRLRKKKIKQNSK